MGGLTHHGFTENIHLTIFWFHGSWVSQEPLSQVPQVCWWDLGCLFVPAGCSYLAYKSWIILDLPPPTDLWAIFEASQFFPRQLSHKGLEHCSHGCGGFAQNAWERFCLWNGAKIHFIKKKLMNFSTSPNLSSESLINRGCEVDLIQPNLCWQLGNGKRKAHLQLSDAQNGTVGASHAAELGFVWLGADGWSLGHCSFPKVVRDPSRWWWFLLKLRKCVCFFWGRR